MLKDSLKAKTQGEANPHNTVVGEGFRISVLDSRLFRLEIQEDNIFEDQASQTVWFRQGPKISFNLSQTERYLEIDTGRAKLVFDKRKKRLKGVFLEGEKRLKRPGRRGCLKGTRRTLDMTFGPVKLGPGLVSKRGLTVFDDSKSLLLPVGQMPQARKVKSRDLYIFAFGRDYRACVNAFYKISGRPPALPPWALGLWWSRFKAYSQAEYLELMDRFEYEGIPLTVATVDMDWHWTDLNRHFGTKYMKRPLMESTCTGGWTGYSWNKELFPDYKEFLRSLKAKNLAVTLNLHPADGVRFFEDMYQETALALGIDPQSKKAVEFRPDKAEFWKAYFELVLGPYEKDGVDFWWIDWQQGKKSAIKGLDPLWALNHFHYLDQASKKADPLILSRYAGPGSHRYPLGFSGDTAINWRVLKFQPYFTATAANVGYTRWSHDIGGHTFGRRDDELYLRWLQLGVFSPIMRLHSTSNELLGKEPWAFSAQTRQLAKEQLILRHRLLPYIYSCDCLTHTKGRALCEPLYYTYPNHKESYKFKNQYMFGTELLVIPPGRKTNKSLKLARVKAWLPPGTWTDIFTGCTYEGSRVRWLYRDTGSMPVFAKAGAIILQNEDRGNQTAPPQNLLIWAYRGNGGFRLIENKGPAWDKPCARSFEIEESKDGQKLVFKAHKPIGNTGILPQERNFKIVFKDIYKPGAAKVYINGKLEGDLVQSALPYSKRAFEIELKNLDSKSEFSIEIWDYKSFENKSPQEKVTHIFSLWQTDNFLKTILYAFLKKTEDPKKLRRKIGLLPLPPFVRKCLIDSLQE